MGKPEISEGHAFVIRQPLSLPYGERHLWTASVQWTGERAKRNTARIHVTRDHVTLYSGTPQTWEQTCAVIEELTRELLEHEGTKDSS